MKSLLPQLEVVTTESTPSGSSVPPPDNVQSKNTERKRDVLSIGAAVATKESDDQSNDTIDEFISSEEVSSESLQKTFSTCIKKDTSSNFFTLPSMWTECESDSELTVLVDSKPSHTHGSAGSSGSATIGSLEQTPIDLSPENTPSDTVSVTVSIEYNKRKLNGDIISVEHNKSNSTIKATLERFSKADQKACVDRVDTNAFPSSTPNVSSQESNSQSLRDDDWHLTLESSVEEDSAPATENPSFTDELTNTIIAYSGPHSAEDDEIATPQAKRTKLNHHHTDHESSCTDTESETDSETVTLTTDVATSTKLHDNDDRCQETRRRSLSVEIIEPKITAYIDLTQEDQLSSQPSDVTGLNKAPPAKDSTVTHMNPQFLDDRVFKHSNVSSCIATDSTPHNNKTSKRSALAPKENSLEGLKRLEPDIIVVGEEEPFSHSARVQSPTRDYVSIEECDTIDYEANTPASSFSGQGSPLCLPPTPGREGVDSILDRKNIAF